MKKSPMGCSLSLVAALGLPAAGCDLACIAIDAMDVKVEDAATGQPVCDAQVTVQGADFPNGMTLSADSCVYVLKSAHQGVYRVEAIQGNRSDGQQVTLMSGECGVQKLSLTLHIK